MIFSPFAAICSALLLIGFVDTSVDACRCIPFDDPCVALWDTTVVLRATIESKMAIVTPGFPTLDDGTVDPQAITYSYEARIQSVYNDAGGLALSENQIITVRARLAGNLCGIELQVGDDLLLDLRHENGVLFDTSSCSMTGEIGKFNECFDSNSDTLIPLVDGNVEDGLTLAWTEQETNKFGLPYISLDGLKLDTKLTLNRNPNSGIRNINVNAVPQFSEDERVKIAVQLKSEPVSRHLDRSSRALQSRKRVLEAQQDNLLERIQQIAPSVRFLANVQVVMNLVVLEIDVREIAAIEEDVDVESVFSAPDFTLYIETTSEHVGATAVRKQYEFDGAGIKIGVLDSGIDYTHASLGGAGTDQAYTNAQNRKNPVWKEDGRVIGGKDFANGDNNPLDDHSFQPDGGHGTHVADIIGGVNGIAPGSKLFALKVCNSGSCSNEAIIQALEYSADPNEDGDSSDALDVINLSFGSDYGNPFDDMVSLMVDNLSALGVVCVVAAGNAANHPYSLGSPSGAASAISVAQTATPTASTQPIVVNGGGTHQMVHQPWSGILTQALNGTLQYANGEGDNRLGCDSFGDNTLDGLIVLVDRGTCTFTMKIRNIGLAGGIAGIIGRVDDGGPFRGLVAPDDGPAVIPGYMISMKDADAIKDAIGALGTIDPGDVVSLVGSIVATSSRGPHNYRTNMLKPEIGAPGESLSAAAGLGRTSEQFSGTSGAAPVVAGAVALLLQSNPDLSPAEVKARLMNTANFVIKAEDGNLAPISRIGSGELQIDNALSTPMVAWDKENLEGGLSFGYLRVSEAETKVIKTIVVKNYGNEAIALQLSAAPRIPNDPAVQLVVPPESVNVGAFETIEIEIQLHIFGDKLEDNYMNSGMDSKNPTSLDKIEHDGNLFLTNLDRKVMIHLPWHVMALKSAKIVTPIILEFDDSGVAHTELINEGVGTAQMKAFNLIALSNDKPNGERGRRSPTPDIRAVGVTTFAAKPGLCSENESFVWAFAITTWETQPLLMPVVFGIYLNIDREENSNYVIFTGEENYSEEETNTSLPRDATSVTWVYDYELKEGYASTYVEHATNTANTVLHVCAEDLGFSEKDLGMTQVDVSIAALDYEFRGPGDSVDRLTVTPGGERYLTQVVNVPGVSTRRALKKKKKQKATAGKTKTTNVVETSTQLTEGDAPSETASPSRAPSEIPSSFPSGAIPQEVPDVVSGETNNLKVVDRGLTNGNTAELGLLLITNSDNGPGHRGGATKDTEAIIVEL
mmetsp:Transcript_26321/g.47742  ORF Transcript_26321/g.47742 Transcript_26321/m.47742 type:complete len:1255 (-) Transcript_26321:206-3970(-)